MKLRIVVFGFSLLVAGTAMIPASGALGAEAAPIHPSQQVRAAAPNAPANSGAAFIVFSDIFETVVCMGTNATLDSWGSCRNQDKSLENNLSDPVRVYFSPNLGGAWACLPAESNYQNLNHANQVFNNGSGDAGYGQQIWENVASDEVFEGSCSNPLPNP